MCRRIRLAVCFRVLIISTLSMKFVPKGRVTVLLPDSAQPLLHRRCSTDDLHVHGCSKPRAVSTKRTIHLIPRIDHKLVW